MKKDMVLETDILLHDKDVFGDEKEHAFDVECYDGYGIAKAIEDNEKVREVRLTYPKMSIVLKDKDLCHEILEYRGLWDLTPSDITFGDIMMALGEIEKI